MSKLQSDFKDLVLEEKNKLATHKPEFLNDSETVDWKKRLGIYQYAVLERQIDSLKDDFEITEKVMGKEPFRRMVIACLKKYPSTYHSLAELSQNVPQFLTEFEETKTQPWLYELAELEWRLIRASLSENFIVNNLSELQNEENQGKDLTFLLNPSIDLFFSKYSVQNFFDDPKAPRAESASYLLIFEKDRSGVYEVLDKNEWTLLKELRTDIPLSKLNQVFASLNVDEAKLGEYFMKWSNAGFISAFK